MFVVWCRSVIMDPLAKANYSDKFSALLFCEELQMRVDIRHYDMKAAKLEVFRENPRFLTLAVPGLAENRPSLLKGIVKGSIYL